MNIVILLGMIFSAVAYFMYARNMIHMFQLNSYKTKVQIKWYREHFGRLAAGTVLLIYTLVLFALSFTELLNKKGTALGAVILLAVLAGALCIASRPRQAKKPLVYTTRIKRLFVTVSVFMVAALAVDTVRILSCGMAELPDFYGSISTVPISPMAAGLTPMLILLGNLINRPVENAVRNHYVREAKDMLKSSPELEIIGITGSFGKTSVKYYLSTLLKAGYNVLMTPESFNTPLGVVRTVREQLKPTHNMFICEMGARNVGDIKELCDLVHPHSGVITSVGEQHLESFKTIDNIVNTKFELENSLPEDGMIFLNGDNELIKKRIADGKLMAGRKYVTYGLDSSNDYFAYDIVTDINGTTFTVGRNGIPERELAAFGESVQSAPVQFHTKLIGSHNVLNIVGAIAVANTYGILLDKLVPQVRKLESVPHRLQLIKRPGTTIIDDAYNSNPAGAAAALETLGMMEGCRIIVTPGMVELGEKAAELNGDLGTKAAAACDYIICVGSLNGETIANGARKAGFPESRLHVVQTLNEAMNIAYGISTDQAKIILLENDLTDNY